MPEIIALAVKDLRILLRDRSGFFFVFFFPLIMAVFFGSIFSGGGSGGSGIGVYVIDEDGSENSKKFVAALEQAPELRVTISTREAGMARVRRGGTTAYLVLLNGFGDAWRNVLGGEPPQVELGVDPARTAEAGMLQGVLARYAAARFEEVFAGSASGAGPKLQPLAIRQQDVAVERILPNSAYAVSFPQGIVWAFIGTAAAFGVSLVIERTRGTLFRLRMAPVSRYQILGGKALACYIMTVAVASVLLLVAVVAFGVRPNSYPHLALAVVCSGVAFVGIMMLVSVLGKTEQSAGGIGWALLLMMSMTGGGMVPLMMMPAWMRSVSHASPVKWLVLSIEGAIWRQFSFSEMMLPCGILLGVGIVFFSLGVRIFDFTQQE
jgi:ABC-2 type transport system permease protein